LQETKNESTPQAYVVNIYRPQQQQNNHDLSSNKYNPGWRNHPNLRWGNSQQQPQLPYQGNAGPIRPYQPPHVQQQQQQMTTTPPNNGPSLEELVKQMAANNLQFQQRTEASIQNLNNQIGQLATSLNQLQSQGSDKLPAQTMVNPQNVSAITLRTGKSLPDPLQINDKKKTIVVYDGDEDEGAATIKRKRPEQEEEESNSSKIPVPPNGTGNKQQPSIPLPFPPKAVQRKKIEEIDKEILETFRKVEVNIPLLDAIKQIPKYAKFLKDLCTHKRRLKGNERISMGRNVSALIGKGIPHIPEKCKDPGTFTIPCIIGNNKFENAMLDLGASINVMPMSVFKSLCLGPLQPTGVIIQLANRSIAHPTGLVEDVLVRK
jgi:hypothetical protein